MTRPTIAAAPKGGGGHAAAKADARFVARRRQVRKELCRAAWETLPLAWKGTLGTVTVEGRRIDTIYPIFLNTSVGPFRLHIAVSGTREYEAQVWYHLRSCQQAVPVGTYQQLYEAIQAIRGHLRANMAEYIAQIGSSVLRELSDPSDLMRDEPPTSDEPYDYARDDLNFDAWREKR